MSETGAMTMDGRKDLILQYFKRLDAGEDLLELFDEHAEVFYPKWGIASGVDEIEQLFGDVGSTVTSMSHDYEYFNYVVTGDTVVVEGTSTGETADGVEWRSDGTPGGGRWCDVFEVRDDAIHRLFIYLDPDYAGADVERYPWLADES